MDHMQSSRLRMELISSRSTYGGSSTHIAFPMNEHINSAAVIAVAPIRCIVHFVDENFYTLFVVWHRDHSVAPDIDLHLVKHDFRQ